MTQPPGRRTGEGASSVLPHLGADSLTAQPIKLDPRVARQRHVVLVVDDTPALLYAVARRLKEQGFTVLEASTGEDGIAMATGADLVVLDVNLPDINGVQVCTFLKDQNPRRPVILMSADYVDDLHREAALSAGGDRFFISPPDSDALAHAIDELIASGGR